MKNIKDLKVNECIHCTTLEDFTKILNLNNSMMDPNNWNSYWENTFYRPTTDTFGNIKISAKEFKYTVHQAREFLNGEVHKITRSQFKEIYDIACSDWKERIEKLANTVLGSFRKEGYLGIFEVQEMFSAATEKQLPVLEKIFPEYGKEEINYETLAEGDRVFLKDTYNLSTKEDLDLDAPFTIVFIEENKWLSLVNGELRVNKFTPFIKGRMYYTLSQNNKVIFTVANVGEENFIEKMYYEI